MKRLTVVVLTIFICLYTKAQDETVKKLKIESDREVKKEIADTLKQDWLSGGIYSLNISQGSLSNWAAGGDNFTLSLNSNLNLFALYKKKRLHWDNMLDLYMAYINTTTLGTRKNDDRIDLVSKLRYQFSDHWSAGLLFNFRSQMLKGYNYHDDPDTSYRTFISSFMSPAYFIVSPGLEYKPNNNLSFFLSPITARWTVVLNDSLSAYGAYGVDTGSHYKSEFGAFASVNYVKKFNKIIMYKSKLDLYSNYLHNPQNIDVYFTNLINMSLSKAISVNYSMDLIYDDDVKLFGKEGKSPATQLKSMLGVGLLFHF